MFGTSATYHRADWGPKGRVVMRRLDHAAIFLLIAGTNTPLALLALTPAHSFRLLCLVWGGAFAGIAQCLFFSRAPKVLAASLYVALGWAVLPFARQYKESLEDLDVALIVAGGIIYSVGVSGVGGTSIHRGGEGAQPAVRCAGAGRQLVCVKSGGCTSHWSLVYPWKAPVIDSSLIKPCTSAPFPPHNHCLPSLPPSLPCCHRLWCMRPSARTQHPPSLAITRSSTCL